MKTSELRECLRDLGYRLVEERGEDPIDWSRYYEEEDELD